MSRSIWKGRFVSKFLLNKKFFDKLENENSEHIAIWTRNSTIPSSLLGETVYVHNGKTFYPVEITREKIGFKFGQFAYTRSLRPKQIKKDTKSKAKKAKK